MKVLRLVPKSCRKRLLIKELQKYRKSRFRRQTLKSRRDGIIISEAIKRDAEKTISLAKKPTQSKTTRELAAYACGQAKSDLERSKAVDNQTRNFASTKKQRKQLRNWLELQK
jgi:hypothetical protein